MKTLVVAGSGCETNNKRKESMMNEKFEMTNVLKQSYMAAQEAVFAGRTITPILIIGEQDGRVGCVPLDSTPSKGEMMHAIHEIIEAMQPDFAIFIGEVFVREQEKGRENYAWKERYDAVMASGKTREGQIAVYLGKIREVNGECWLEDGRYMAGSDCVHSSILPNWGAPAIAE